MTSVHGKTQKGAVPQKENLNKISELFKDIEENRQFCEDFFLGRHEVTTLGEENFKDFLTPKEVALVMFYDPVDENCVAAKSHFLEAANNNTKENSAFAAVNCVNETKLCKDQKVTHFPFFRLFSKGLPVSTIKDFNNFTEAKMNSYVDSYPAVLQTGKQKRL